MEKEINIKIEIENEQRVLFTEINTELLNQLEKVLRAKIKSIRIIK